MKNETQNGPPNHENSSPRSCPRALWRPPWVVLGSLGTLLELSGVIWWRFLAKMDPRWTQDGPSWQQVAAKMGHDSAKMTVLGSVWQLLGGSWEHSLSLFSGSLEKWPKCKNEQHYNTLGGFFGGLGPPLEGPGGCLGSVLGAILEDVGSKMVLSWLS